MAFDERVYLCKFFKKIYLRIWSLGKLTLSYLLLVFFFQGLNPGRAIAEIKKLLAGFAEKGTPGLEGTAGLTQYSDK